MKMQKTIASNSTEDKWWEKTVKEQQPVVQEKTIQQITFQLGQFDDEARTFQAIASTPVTDRMGDSIDQAGWILDNFLKNPVIPWGHDYYTPPVARATEIGVNNQGYLQFTYQAPPVGLYDLADTVWNLYRNQFMFAFSVGFIPLEYEGNWEDGYTFTQCELLEISAVVVPANPQAVALAMKNGTISNKQAKALRGKMLSTIKNLDVAIDVLSKAKKKDAISTDTLPLADKGVSWDSGAAIKDVKAWASDDDGNIDYTKYAKAFMWVDPDNADQQGGYKLPFADVIDGELKAVWNAIKAIMGILNGAQGGVNIPDDERNDVYSVVKKYYKAFGEDVPELSDSGGDNDNDGKGLTNDETVRDNIDMTKTKSGATISSATKDKLQAVHDAMDDTKKSVTKMMNDHMDALKSIMGQQPTSGDDSDDEPDEEVTTSDDDDSKKTLKSKKAKDVDSEDEEVETEEEDSEEEADSTDDKKSKSKKSGEQDEDEESESDAEVNSDEEDTDEGAEQEDEDDDEQKQIDENNLTDKETAEVIAAVEQALAEAKAEAEAKANADK